MSKSIPFAAQGLDRAQPLRRDPGWLQQRLDDEASRFLPLWQLEILLRKEPDAAVGELAWARGELRSLAAPENVPILLGMAEGIAHFALDVSNLEKPAQALGLGETAQFVELRAIASQIPSQQAAIAAQARALVHWHARNGYCAACGSTTLPEQGGALRRCPECAAEHFPRTDPVVIAAVVSGDRCLLGRSAGWPEGMYSALAGFVEPGEKLEDALRREILEEANIRVGGVRYIASQPWPFPSSLMIGCIAQAETDAIRVDHSELEDARWFSRTQVTRALEAPTPELILPPPLAIAHHLIHHWARGED